MNQSYALASIDNYTKSVVNPSDVINNPESVIWLAWCHSVSLMHDIPLPGLIADARDLESVHSIVKPAEALAMDLARANCFTWKK